MNHPGMLKVKISESRILSGQDAAAAVEKNLHELLLENAIINIVFAAAPSQNEFLSAFLEAGIDWSRINAFHMDEYIGLSADAPQGFGNFLKKAIFDKRPFNAVYLLNGNAPDLKEECKRYSILLKQYPPHIVCMGIGENGHIAFNDPPVADFNDQQMVKLVELEQDCRQQQVNDGCFTSLKDVPTHAITLTIPALMSAKYIHCVVPGKTKAHAASNTLHQEIIEKYPSTILRTHDNATLYLDNLSSSLLSKE